MRYPPKFKIGDRVKVVRPSYVGSRKRVASYFIDEYLNRRGTIVRKGYNGYTWHLSIGFSVNERELELIKRGK